MYSPFATAAPTVGPTQFQIPVEMFALAIFSEHDLQLES